MSNQYNHKEIESHWQKKWDKEELYKTKEPKNNEKGFFALSMFPYPSGNLHMGHVRNYVLTDVIARYKRMCGLSVLHPMGWDAFGLPAENAAIQRNIQPEEWTKRNIKTMKIQLKELGLSIDWEREITTCNDDYYKWSQYIFILLFNNNLAYQKKAKVNWDPIDKTVLANEQVNADGKSWRSGAVVEQKELKQWFFAITKYADELNDDLRLLNGWPEKVKTMQSNWIGKSVGADITFRIDGSDIDQVKVFTTRPETLFGVSYIAIAPEHELIEKLISKDKKIEYSKFLKKHNKNSNQSKNNLQINKNGFFLGIYAINPINNNKIPIWISDYVLIDYGYGALMGVPGHDQRDFEFAIKYNIPINYVIDSGKINDYNNCIESEGILINSGNFNGLNTDVAKSEIIKFGTEKRWAKKCTNYKLKDWLISRQRYWGCPIPIINCNKCGNVTVKIENLPVKLPDNINISGKGKSPLENNEQWLNTKCPKCGNKAKRETDTMDTFICSSWYYLRYTDPKNNKLPFDKESSKKWLPVDQYVGGVEHAILHLLYSRFITKVFNKTTHIDIKEPFNNLLTQGMVQSNTYINTKSNKYISKDDISDLDNPTDPITGEKLDVIYEKMSKSKFNGVDPKSVINKYGADTARMFILFKAPPEKDLEWDDSDLEGQYRFITKIYKLMNELKLSKNNLNISSLQKQIDALTLNSNDKKLRRYTHLAIKKISDDLNRNKHNTAISELMILTNKIIEFRNNVKEEILYESIITLIKLIAPFSPHLSEEIWGNIGNHKSVHLERWPLLDKQALEDNEYQLVLQINGKVRSKLNLSKDYDNQELEALALNNQVIKKWINDKEPKKIIIVKRKLINIVI